MKRPYRLSALLLTVAIASTAQGAEYSIELIAASPADGFNFPYVLRTPDTTSGAEVLLVETNNTGNKDDFERHVVATLAAAEGHGLGPLVSEAHNLPLLIPVFPRSETKWEIYTHALDSDTLLIEDGPQRRLDLQLIQMIADAQARLSEEPPSLPPKVIMVGFSASGTFANRFAFLHPRRLVGVVSGAVNATPMLPVAHVEDVPLPFPLGVFDIADFIDGGFDEEAWRALPQLIFMGAADDNDAVEFDDAYSDAERRTVYTVLGRDMGVRWRAAQAIYLAEEANVTFVTYGRVGHWTNRRIHHDIFNFVEDVIRKASAE